MKKLILILFILISCGNNNEQVKFGQRYIHSNSGIIYSEARNTDYSTFYGKTIKFIYADRNSPIKSYQVIIIFEDGTKMGIHNYKYEPRITY